MDDMTPMFGITAAHRLRVFREGGNATGFTTLEPTMAGKWLELLKEIAPGVNRAALLFNPATMPSIDNS